MMLRARKYLRPVAATAIVGLLLSGCGSDEGSSSVTAADGDTTVRMAYLPTSAYAPLTIGDQQGFFAEQGVTVERENVVSPAAALANVASGRLQFSSINVGSLGQALLQNVPVQVVAASYYDDVTQGIYVNQDSPIRELKDLEGKTLGLGQLENNLQAAVETTLTNAGVDVEKVKFTLVPIADAAASLRAGSVDATQVAEPFITREGDAIRPLIERPWDVLGAGEPHIVSYIITSKAFAETNPEAVDKFVAGWNESLEFAAANPEELRKVIGQITDLPPDLLANIRLATFSPDLDEAGAEAQLDLMVKTGIIPEKPDLAAAMPN